MINQAATTGAKADPAALSHAACTGKPTTCTSGWPTSSPSWAPDLGGRSEASVDVPLVGRIAAGAPLLAEEMVEDVYSMPRQVVGDGDLFALTVVRDSMIDAAICDGDIVAALLDDEATVKVLSRQGGRVWLMPRNPSYDPIPGDEARILGKVVGVLRLL